jgi:BirA family biotin operon repressor/biotin-[acetyl-CoA-carboxylase] ligase
MFNKDKFFDSLETVNFGRDFYYFDKLSSTNGYTLERKLPVFSVVATMNQTAGRGRSGRKWVEFPGDNLYFTLILPLINVKQILPLNLLAGFALCDVIRGYLQCYLKWPNDIVYCGKKLGGILIETKFSGNVLTQIVLGVGVNVNSENTCVIVPHATSLYDELQRKVSPEKLLSGFLNTFETYFEKFVDNKINIAKEWHRYSAYINSEISVHVEGLKKTFREEGVDENGGLIVKEKSGKVSKIYSGEIGYDFCR